MAEKFLLESRKLLKNLINSSVVVSGTQKESLTNYYYIENFVKGSLFLEVTKKENVGPQKVTKNREFSFFNFGNTLVSADYVAL